MNDKQADLITKIILGTAKPADFYKLFPKHDSFPQLNEFLKNPAFSDFGVLRDYTNINVLDGSFNLGKKYAILRRIRGGIEGNNIQDGYIVEVLKHVKKK